MALVNTAPSPRHGDRLTTSEHLNALLADHDEPGPIEVGDDDLRDARAAREDLAAVFAVHGDQVQVAAKLNELLARTATPRLVAHNGVPLHLHVDAPDSSWGEWLAASGAMALALLVAEHGIDVIGRCEAPDCTHAVVRVGPGPARRYCDSTCASRTRVAAHRANRKPPSPS